MSSITRSALSTVWKICGVTRRAWNWNQLTPRAESGMRGTRLRVQETRKRVPPNCSGSRVGCTFLQTFVPAGKMPTGPTGPSRTGVRLPCYGDFFGEGDADAAAAGDAAGGVAGASAGLTLSSSTSKIRVALGPMSAPAPPGP